MSYLTNDLSLDTTVQLSRVQQNDAALDTAISGNLTEAAMSSSTRFPSGASGGPTMLANDDVEEIITLVLNPRYSAGAILGAASTTIPLAFARIGGTGTYTITSATYAYVVITGGGASNGSVSLRLGSIAANLWSTSATIAASTALNQTLTAGQSAEGDFTLSTTTFTAPKSIALMPEVAGATNIISLVVTLKLTRSLQ